MREINVLWVDDEISFLKPHIIFLEKKNYKIRPCQSGSEALEIFKSEDFDFLIIAERSVWEVHTNKECIELADK